MRVGDIEDGCVAGRPGEGPGGDGGVVWRVGDAPVDYRDAVGWMEERVAAIAAGRAAEAVWLLEHPPLYTAGTSACDDELLDAGALPVYRCGRGGRYTYHGPGQRIAYVLLDLRRRGADVRAFVCALESWMIAALARLDVQAERRPGRIGLWIPRAGCEDAKIAAIGVRVRRWVSYHGVAINLDPDLARFEGIVPCGLHGAPVTSLRALGLATTMAELDAALRGSFAASFPAAALPVPG